MKTKARLCYTIALVSSLLASAWAQDIEWTNASGDQDYQNAANWTGTVPARVPGSGGNASDNALFQQTTGVPAQLRGSASAVNSIKIGGLQGGSAATLDVLPGASISANSLTAGFNNNAPGRLRVSGGLVTVGDVYSGGLEGGVGTLNVSGGALAVTNTAGVRVAWGTDADGVVNDTSGSTFSISGTGTAVSAHGISVGGAAGDADYNDSGTVSVSDAGKLFWSEAFTLQNGSTFSVQGSGGTIIGSGGGDVLKLLGTDTLEFIMDDLGVTTVDLDNNGGTLFLSSTANISVDGSAYVGQGGTFTLISHGGYSGATVFKTENLDFSPQYSASLLYAQDKLQLVVDRVPEPSGMALLLLGGGALGILLRRTFRLG